MTAVALLSHNTYSHVEGTFQEAAAEVFETARWSDQILTLHARGGTICSINSASNIHLLDRDFRRGSQGLGPTIFGPWSPETLSMEEERSDYAIQNASDVMGIEHRVRIFNEMRSELMDFSNERAWKDWAEEMTSSDFSAWSYFVIAIAWRTARLIQARTAAGNTLKACWKQALHDANFEDLAFGSDVITLLTTCWAHGAKLQRLYAQEWQSTTR